MRIAHLKPIFGITLPIPHLIPYMVPHSPLKPTPTHDQSAEGSLLPVCRQSPRTVSARPLIIPAHFRHIPPSGYHGTQSHKTPCSPKNMQYAMPPASASFYDISIAWR